MTDSKFIKKTAQSRVLVIGPSFFGYNQSIARGFQQAGWLAETLDFYRVYPPDLKNVLLCGLPKQLGVDHFIKRYDAEVNSRIVRVYDKFKPDIVFIIRGDKLSHITLQHMSSSKLVLWMMDSIFHISKARETIQLYDYVFCFDNTDVDLLKAEGIESHFLPLAVDESIYFPVETREKDIDILFVGELYENRLQILEKLVQDFADRKIMIFGRYLHWKIPISYPRVGKYFLKRLHRYFHNRNVTPRDVNLLYSRAKICLNIHHSQSVYGCNQRFFEIQGAKSFQAVDANPYIKENFKDHVATYRDYSELGDLLGKHLANEGERKRIAEYGYRTATKNHRFVDRVSKVLEIVRSEV